MVFTLFCVGRLMNELCSYKTHYVLGVDLNCSESVPTAEGPRGPAWVSLDKTQIEHNESAYAPTAALERTF
jgi:hypothetical protein